MDFTASGLHLFSGKVLCCDTTMVSALDSAGNPHSRSSAVPGICLDRAKARKEDHYFEIVQSSNTHLLVLACETGGRFNDESMFVLRELAKHKAWQAPRLLRRSAEFALLHRWSNLLSVAVQNAFASSLLDADPVRQACVDDPQILFSEVINDYRYEDVPAISRMPG